MPNCAGRMTGEIYHYQGEGGVAQVMGTVENRILDYMDSCILDSVGMDTVI